MDQVRAPGKKTPFFYFEEEGMKKKKISFLWILPVLIFILFSNDSWAAGEKYPTGTISNICLFGPGSAPDLFNRVLSRQFEKYLGVPVVTLSKAGGGGAIGILSLVSARPDGYTVCLASLENMIVPTITEGKAPYSLQDLTILGQIVTSYNVLVVAADSPWKTFQDFVDYARKNPGVKYGCPGIRSTLYMRMETLSRNARLGLTGVPFDGRAEITAAVLGKHIPIGLFDLASARELQAAGKIRILFLFESPESAGIDPKTPCMATAMDKSVGEKDIDISQIMLVHSRTPDEIKVVLKRTLEKTAKDPDFLADLKKMEVMLNYIDGDAIMQNKLPSRLEQVKAFYKERGWVK
jgi:tripartite-type tricarboxylate transporter receptor subunit TctC